MRVRSLSAGALLLLFATVGFAQNSMIRGKVRGTNGTSVNNAIVELKQSAAGLVAQTATRNEGDFAFTNLRAGEYEVVVSFAGYQTVSEIVHLRDSMMINSSQATRSVISEVATVDITLLPRPEPILGAPGTSFAQDVPKAARAAYEKGIAKLRDGKSDEGIALLREATTAYNDYFDAHFALGSEFYRIGKDNEALEELERARQINDRGGAVYYTFGMVMARQQKFRAAEYAFGKAAALNENHVAAHFNHAVSLIELALRAKEADEVKKRLAEAERELDRSWELSGRRLNTVFLQRARVQEERGNKEAAARELENYLKAEPNAKNVAVVKEAIGRLRDKK